MPAGWSTPRRLHPYLPGNSPRLEDNSPCPWVGYVGSMMMHDVYSQITPLVMALSYWMGYISKAWQSPEAMQHVQSACQTMSYTIKINTRKFYILGLQLTIMVNYKHYHCVLYPPTFGWLENRLCVNRFPMLKKGRSLFFDLPYICGFWLFTGSFTQSLQCKCCTYLSVLNTVVS